jgi:hypothetical protein
MRKAKYNRPLTIAFKNDMFQKIRQKSDEREISMASWVRQAIDKILTGKNEEISGCETCSQENCNSRPSHDHVTGLE